jgi:nicotinate-nucleotide adenylyltransferase
MTRRGFIGGSFNPIHDGHLKAALEAAKALALDSVTFIPAYQSPLKDAHSVSAEHRLAMVELAVADSPLLRCDDREISRQGRSFTVDTVRELRQDFGDDAPLFWIMGDDLLATLNQWSRWQSLVDYCHLVVLTRPGHVRADCPGEVADWLDSHAAEIVSQPSGSVQFLELPLITMSSTSARESFLMDRTAKLLLPTPVMEYIEAQALYRDRESTLETE